MFDVAKVIETCNLAHVQPGALKDVNFLGNFQDNFKGEKKRQRSRRRDATQGCTAAHRSRAISCSPSPTSAPPTRLLPLPDELFGSGV